jgi:hypothetical protein
LGDQIERNEVGGACSTYEERRGVFRVLEGGLREGDHLGDPGIGGRIPLRWIFKEWDGAWTGLIWLRIGTGAGRL